MTELPLVRSSERGALHQCAQAWYWRYEEKLVPITAAIGAADYGTGLHLAMAEYYVPETPENRKKFGKRRGRSPIEVFNEWAREQKNYWTATEQRKKKFDGKEFEEECEKIRGVIREWLLKEKGNPSWEVIAGELTFSANIDGKAIAVGTIDLVVRDTETGYVWILDWKTRKGFSNEAAYNIEDQGGSYSSIATTILRHKKLIGEHERVKGIIFIEMRKAKADDRPENEKGEKLNKNGSVSKVQPQPLFKKFVVERNAKQQKHQLQRIVKDVAVMDAIRKGVIPVTKSPGKLCPYCDFFQLCQLDENMGDVESMKTAMFKKLDPYHDHREGAQNSKLSVKADTALKRSDEAGNDGRSA